MKAGSQLRDADWNAWAAQERAVQSQVPDEIAPTDISASVPPGGGDSPVADPGDATNTSVAPVLLEIEAALASEEDIAALTTHLTIPGVILSPSSGQKDDVYRILIAGCDEYLLLCCNS